ncbi:carbohydrate binding domain-containing protein, partial [Pseudomonas sp. PS02290]|uniref:carbohydrate binding domain-containing protein n=1 Tax=Pseudomonas sp. PS02290 TaxID=2991430 RepID=UPI002499D92C
SPGAQATTVSKDDYLINLTDGSTLRLILEVSFDGGLTRRAFPVQSYTVIAKPTEIAPTITSVIGADGIEIPDGASTTETSGKISGTGTKNYQVRILDNDDELEVVDTDSNGNWSTRWGTYLANSNHRFYAQTISGKLRSNERRFTIIPTLTIWNFDDNTFQGWTPQGPYVQNLTPREGSLYCGTPGGFNWSGNVISRTINLLAGKTYSFEFSALRVYSGPTRPQFILLINNSRIGPWLEMPNKDQWYIGNGSFHSTDDTQVTLSIWNDNSSSDGNDFRIDYVSMRQVV